MAIQLIRKTDTVALVCTADESVTLPEGASREPVQWVEADKFPHGADATVVTIRPLVHLEVHGLAGRDFQEQCHLAVRAGLVSLSGVETRDEAVDAIPYKLAPSLGAAILSYTFGAVDPFGLVAPERRSGSTSSGRKASPSASTKGARPSATRKRVGG